MTDIKPKVGFTGIGLLGTGIARRLVDCGFPVMVWNRTPEKMASLLDAGATRGATPAEMAANSDILMTCVTDTAAVEAVVFGEDGYCAADVAGKLLVDMSTIDATATREMAARALATAGLRWIDAPISGGAPAALKGAMTVMAGGSEEDFEAARPIWDAVAGRCTLMGPSGAGQTTKMINQVLVLDTFAVLAEAAALAMGAGVDPALIPKALEGGRADSKLLQECMPKIAGQDPEPMGKNSISLKDMEMLHDLARATGTPMPVSALVTEMNRQLVLRGLGEECPSTFVRLLIDKG
jgi:3-hydroxyisobutyrate dehydrogenase